LLQSEQSVELRDNAISR